MEKIFNNNTIRFEAKFYDFDDKLVDPSLVKMIFYDYKQNKMSEHVLAPANRVSVGSYFFDYTFEIAPKEIIYYEWYSEIDSKVSLYRDKIVFSFA